MNAVALVEQTRVTARQLEDKHRTRGLTREQARESIARVIGVTPSTLDSIARRRVKNPHRLKGLFADLMAEVLRQIDQERARLDHEEMVLRQSGYRVDSDEMQEVAKDKANLEALAEEALK